MLNEDKIKQHQDKLKTAQKMEKWAKQLQIQKHEQALAYVLVLKPKEKAGKEVAFKKIPAKGEAETEEEKTTSTGLYPVMKKYTRNNGNEKKRHSYNTRSSTGWTQNLESDDEGEKKEDARQCDKRNSVRSHRNSFDGGICQREHKKSHLGAELESHPDIPQLQTDWLMAPQAPQPPPAPHCHPPSYQPSEANLFTPTTAEEMIQGATHKVKGGALSLVPLGSTPIDEKLQDIQLQLNALTNILESQVATTQKLTDLTRHCAPKGISRQTSDRTSDSGSSTDPDEPKKKAKIMLKPLDKSMLHVLEQRATPSTLPPSDVKPEEPQPITGLFTP
ncbi:hypothetical protein NQD34_018433 [Periophthalmus magnuspinnatus]|nr:hypothetical protein NQD34_018433 [Periophthalmus magnuspinnatus]